MVMEPQKVIRLQQTGSPRQRRALLFARGHGIDVWGKSQRDFPTAASRAFYKRGWHLSSESQRASLHLRFPA